MTRRARACSPRMRTKASEEAIPVITGDMATARAPGRYTLVYLVYNTISNLLTQSEQVACFRNAARHREPVDRDVGPGLGGELGPGAHPLYKAALADPRYTATTMTRAFSGRLARGLVNQFIRDHADAPAAYPEINNATRPQRSVSPSAASESDTERMSPWAGRGYCRTSREIIVRLCAIEAR